ncbi:MAG: sulfatase-like hydrolase/transferase [Roseobacter sp.]
MTNQDAELEALRGPVNAYDRGDCPLFQAWRTRVPEELHPTRYVQTMTEEALGRYAEDISQPFFHWASFCDPHHPFTPPGRYWDMYDPADMTLPASFTTRDPDSWAAALHDLRRAGYANLEGTGALAATEEELRWATALTFGLISMIDDAVGAMLAALKRHKLDRDTIVIFLSDHGDLMGDHGLIFKGPFHYKSVIRMPLIWYDPHSPEGKTCENMVSAVDVPASILDAAKIPAFQGMNGRSFLANTGRDAVLIEDEVQTNLPDTNVRGRARSLVTKDWRVTLYDGIENGEMFDLENDPLETRNLWHDPNTTAQKARLIEHLLREMLANSDTGTLPDYAA